MAVAVQRWLLRLLLLWLLQGLLQRPALGWRLRAVWLCLWLRVGRCGRGAGVVSSRRSQ